MNNNVDMTIIEAKRKMLNTVNEILHSGVPISVVDMMLDVISNEVKSALKFQLNNEAQDLTKLDPETV